MEKSNEQYQQIINAADNAVFIAQNEHVVFANPKTWGLTGYTASELFQMPSRHIIHPQDHGMWRHCYQSGMAGKKINGAVTCRFVKKNSDSIWVEITTAPITWEQQPGVLYFARDITLEKELMTQLQLVQKMEAIGTLAGGIAHDFNNILTPILMNTEIVLLDLPLNSPFRTSLEEVLDASFRARELVKQILCFSRQNEQERVPLKISILIKESLKLLRSSLPSTIEIHMDIRTQNDLVFADPAQIHQVLTNLCTNAAYAMRESGGVLAISLEEICFDSGDSMPAPGLFPGPYVKLLVSDTGCGMAQASLQRIFDPYYSTKARAEGTGLGLAVVHGIVKSYNGVITVDSKLEKGTTFEIYFPGIQRPDELKPEELTPIPGGNENILCIDDEIPMIDSYKSMLERLGYHVTTETSSLKALEHFRSKPGGFDLVITDQTMPYMTGDKLARELIKTRPDIPIILCTGFSNLINEVKAKEIGIRAFIMKPVVMREMATLMRKILDDT